MVDSDEWGEGGGKGEGRVGTDEGGGNGAAGLSSSMGTHFPWVEGCCQPCALAAHQEGGVLSMGVHQMWVAHHCCIWEGCRCLLGIMVVCGGT